MNDTPTPSPAAAVSRKLTVAEVATIRAALRAWTAVDDIVDSVERAELVDAGAAEIDGAPIVTNAAIEQLLADLGAEAVAVTVTRFTHDGRRI